ncbi:polygalacturonase 1 beta-like protein 3 [Dioscorea cayenensis subsp. rotundata]|uniref:Polygalacturonase 1 beta-like protein 3 n=1 Tax=Dioscorea cayennensis subsp. rotundata TaxID=55577 RepID=A0AB40ANI8_DIOCR|nr:polygalacturonase 1 beta-like protein 3 [Dioscorea cayenensis subsp. rotundata]
MAILLHPFFLFMLFISIFINSIDAANSFSLFTAKSAAANAAVAGGIGRPNPFTAKAAALRYWDRKIPDGGQNHPSFLTSKLSPLSAVDSATYSTLAGANPSSLTPHLPALCSAAHLLCAPAISSSLSSDSKDSNFISYENRNFTNYGTAAAGGANSFKNYSDSLNVPVDTFRRYSRDSAGHDESFASYSREGNVVTTNFTSYATAATGGAGSFSSYHKETNVPNLKFSNYNADANGHTHTFTSYADDTNSGDQSFSGYGKHGNDAPSSFTSYGNNSNVIGSTFTNYAEEANAAGDSFNTYGFNGNVPENNFKNYADEANAATETFTSYRDQSNVGDDSFRSYGDDGNNPTLKFSNYGNSFNEGSDRFQAYAENANNPNVSFKGYNGDITGFSSYSKTGVTFKNYKNSSVVPPNFSPEKMEETVTPVKSGKIVNRWVEPGKFFRESSLKEGTVMPMPDIRDKMPERSFLPRSIAEKLPFSATELSRIFGAPADTALGKAVADTIAECERKPSRGETKRCATSAEDMIDFAAEVIGSSAVPRSTETVDGSNGQILVGRVKGLNGGKVTKAVSCHQSLFPYLTYYCHSVPMVRVYEAEILAVDSKKRINRGVAICHLDTSDWSEGHGAFVALGFKPGEIEVCHWIFEGDMTWTVAD